jgi:hypothetical protein
MASAPPSLRRPTRAATLAEVELSGQGLNMQRILARSVLLGVLGWGAIARADWAPAPTCKELPVGAACTSGGRCQNTCVSDAGASTDASSGCFKCVGADGGIIEEPVSTPPREDDSSCAIGEPLGRAHFRGLWLVSGLVTVCLVGGLWRRRRSSRSSNGETGAVATRR